MSKADKKIILVVDDDADTRDAIFLNLSEQPDFTVIACTGAEEALDKVKKNNIDVVLTDIVMPEVSGIELLEKIHHLKHQLPVILMTGYADLNIAIAAIKKGAFDFILKPFHPDYLHHSIKKALQHTSFLKLKEDYNRYLENMVLKRTEELEISKKHAENLSHDVVKRLTTVAEFRDIEAMEHVSRIGFYSEIVARELGMPEDFIQAIKFAAPLHDIGKIGVLDSILLKPGALTHEEFEVIKTHTMNGERILSGSRHPVLQMATSIALNHHEKWDGTGYPKGLKGDAIPFEGRIVCIVDQYDAIRNKRVYKPSFSHEEAVKKITQGDDRTRTEHFDPDVLDATLTQFCDNLRDGFPFDPPVAIEGDRAVGGCDPDLANLINK
ncbi:MAG: response regulator [Nitrospiraceae bacterium]|nr:MAG: response regulator [Nitrospiraceae bacterium]